MLYIALTPPPKADLNVFTSSVYDLMALINDQKSNALIMGDTNIDLLKCNNHPRTNDYLDNIFSLDFIPLITKPTRVTKSSATLIDHMYTNNPSCENMSGIIYHY